MRRLFLSVLGCALPCVLSAGGLYSIAPVSPGGDLAIPATAPTKLLGSGGVNASGAFSSPGTFSPSGTPGYPSFSGYSGQPLNALRPQMRGLHPGALDSLNQTSKPRLMRHRWALGVDSVPAASVADPSGSLVALPSALSLRWWATERLGIDILAGGNYSSSQAGASELHPLYSSAPGNASYAGGLGLRYNVSELGHDLFSQFVVKASGAQAAGAISGFSGKATQTTLAVFVGAGFEAFVPWWDWLSVEASVGVTGFSQSLTPQGAAAETTSGFGLAGSGFSPFNLAAHAYF